LKEEIRMATKTISAPVSAGAATGGISVPPAAVTIPPRFQQGAISTALQLGPLASFAGTWAGSGFNAIWRPDNPQSQPVGGMIKRFLELNLTSETIEFDIIPGVVPNRGLAPQTDLSLYGLHYLQRVSDADLPPFETAGQALHIEPGLFMNVPASTSPAQGPTIVRMASIPHGVTVMMQGPTPSSTPVPGPPIIPPIFPIAGLPSFEPKTTTPNGLGIQPVDAPPPGNDGLEHIVPENQSTAGDGSTSQSNGPFPTNFQNYVNDPNIVLRNAIAGQEILGTIAIQLSTENVPDSIGNIPFLGAPNASQPQNPGGPPNAFVSQASATFWIEWVKIPGMSTSSVPTSNSSLLAIEPFWPTPTYLQLQYSQVVILVFNNVLWPHVTVATLRLSAG
jgi:hypothetical protein